MKTTYLLATDKGHAESRMTCLIDSRVANPEQEFRRMCQLLKDMDVTTPNHKQKIYRIRVSAEEVRI